jgi:hypothetical protein
MLNFKFLKWAALCGLLVFALGGCAKETDPCGGSSTATDPAIEQSVAFMYVDAETEFPLVGRKEHELFPYEQSQLSFEVAPPFTDSDGRLSVGDAKKGTVSTVAIHLSYGSCYPSYPSDFQMEGSGLCFKGYIHMENAFTDTLEVYSEIDQWDDCGISGRIVYYLNGKYVAEGPMGNGHTPDEDQPDGSVKFWFDLKK